MLAGVSKLMFWVTFALQIDFKQGHNLNRYKLRSPPADITIGGLFPVHVDKKSGNSGGRKYHDLNYNGLAWTEAVLYIIDEINNSSAILPKFSLGFDIRDSYNDVQRALHDSLDFILETGENATSQKGCSCGSKTSPIAAVIGGAASPISTNVAHVFGVSKIPQISYSSTSVLLSNKNVYRSFLRTIPSDTYQAKSIADLLVEFKWTYVSVVASDSEYGRAGMDALKMELKKRNICMAVEMLFHPNLYTQELTRIITSLKKQVRARVIVLWCQRPNAIRFLEQATKLGVKGKTWIGTETWGDSYLLKKLSPNIVGGMLGIVPQLKRHQKFEEHLDHLDPGNSRRNPWFSEFWELEFGCQTVIHFTHMNVSTSSPGVNNATQLFTNGDFFLYKSNTDDSAIVRCPRNKGKPSANILPRAKCTNVMDAVYAVALAVQFILNCTVGQGLLPHGKCPSTHPFIKPEHLLRYIQNVSFVGRSGKEISFDENGDLKHGSYAIKGLQPITANSSTMEFLEIGSWDGADGKWEFLQGVDYLWNGWVKEVPSSRCNDLCGPGEYAVNGSTKCCWTCVTCPKGYAKKSRGLGPCTPCPEGHESDSNRSHCIKRSDVYMDLSSGRALSVTIISVFGGLLGSTLFAIFIRHRTTAVVKASNRELSLIHLSILILTFMYPFVLIGKPTTVRCGLKPFLFSILFTTTTSITLLKTDRLLRIFRSKSRLSSQSRLLTNKMQLVTAAALTSVPLAVASMWLLVRPPEITITEGNDHNRIIRCSDNADTLQIIILSYVLLLALVCTYFAYRARELPENFNEAKFIGFAMFSFCVFWMSFVPAFYSSTGVSRTFVHCLAVLSSTFAVMCIIYYPKVRIILFFPQQNRTEVFRINASTMNISNRPRATSASGTPPPLSPMPSPMLDHKVTNNENTLRLPLSAHLGNRRLSAISVGRGIVFAS